MSWEIRLDGRRYRMRKRRARAAGVVMLVLLLAGAACIAAGVLTGVLGGIPAPKALGAAAVRTALASPPVPSSTRTPAPSSGKAIGRSLNDDWRLTLVNAGHPLPEGYHVDTRELPNGLSFDARATDDLMKMVHDAKDQGMSLVLCSAYRSYDKQRELYNNKVAKIQQEEGKSYDQAYQEARNTVALPGTSEHNLGLAVDIVALSYQQLDEGYLDTAECKWLQANSWKYGFIMRYPDGKSDVTHIIFEPWHYRYVGEDAAKEIHESGQCLEEYLAQAE